MSMSAGVSIKPCSRRRSELREAAHTHEIRDHEGRWIWRGDEGSMQIIFANLSSANFEDSPSGSTQTHAEYMAWMRRYTAECWPGRADPYQAGQLIELAEVSKGSGRVIESFRFDASCCAEEGGCV